VTHAGELRHRIDLQSSTGTADDAGEVIESWSDYASNLPAKYEGIAGSEVDRADQRTAVGKARFTIRHRDDVTPLHRVAWGSRTFQITDVFDEIGRQRWLTIECTELKS
jgi:SPP1 family predicted phage head-tail adaptor